MTRITQSLFKTLHTSLLAALVLVLPIAAQAAHHEEEEANGRAMALTVEAVVTAIDLETRHVSLQGPGGEIFTVNSPEAAVKLEDIKVGDRVVATYIAALEGELRAPTEEELAEPWVVIEDAAISEDPATPAMGGARVVRAAVGLRAKPGSEARRARAVWLAAGIRDGPGSSDEDQGS